MSYDNWRARLAISQKYTTVAERRAAVAALKINFSQPGPADEGYYRKPITIKNPNGNGQSIVTGWLPVAYYLQAMAFSEMEQDVLCGAIGNRNMTDLEIGDEQLWSWVVGNPIPHEWYTAVAERGEPWPDFTPPSFQPTARDLELIEELKGAKDPAFTEAPAERVIAKGDNLPPEEKELPLDLQHKAAIDNAIGAAKDLKATTVEEAAIAAGAANVIRDRRLAAEKVAAARTLPLKLAYDTERDKWVPMVKLAKDEETRVRKLVAEFEASERTRVAEEQLAALAKQREIDEANARAADRAIAAGNPEPPPVVEEVVIPQAAPRVTPTYGGYKPREKLILKFAVINDPLEVCKHFLADPALVEVIQKLATNAVRANLVVPGATFREGTE